MQASPGDGNTAIRSQWEGPVGIGLVVLFLLAGHQVWLIGTSLDPLDLGHAVFVVHTAAGLWVSCSGLLRGDSRNRLLCLPVLLFFTGVIALLYFKGHP